MDARLSPDRTRRTHRTRGLAATLLLAVITVVSGCSAAATPPPSLVPTTPVPSAAATPTPAPAFPAALTDDDGTAVTLKAEPQKIITMTPGATDTLFALGLGSRVVGKSEDIAPTNPSVGSVPNVVTYQGADVEKIVALTPDLVIAGGHNLNRPDDIAKLRSLHIPVLVIYASDLKGILADITLVGRAVGRPAGAATIVADIQGAFAEVKAAAASATSPRVYAELDASGGYWLPAPDDLLTDMIRAAKGDPLTSGTPGVYQIDQEKILAFDPQVILLSDTYAVSVGDVAKRAGWSVISAVKTGDVRPIDASTATRPGPSLAAGIRALAVAIHPGLVLPNATSVPSAADSTTP